MKDKILTLIIGILIGAIITAAGFLIYENVNEDDDMDFGQGQGMQMDGNSIRGGGDGEAPDMQDGNFTPSDIPDKSETSSGGETDENT